MFIFVIFRGSVIYYRQVGECDLFLLFTVNAVGVSLKSGSFFGSWLALVACLYLASHSFIAGAGHDRAGKLKSYSKVVLTLRDEHGRA
jgi:hypothetical protein